jgi:hypothetical protein
VFPENRHVQKGISLKAKVIFFNQINLKVTLLTFNSSNTILGGFELKINCDHF